MLREQGEILGQVGFEAPSAPASPSSFLVSHLLPLRLHIVPGLRLAGPGRAPLGPLTWPLPLWKAPSFPAVASVTLVLGICVCGAPLYRKHSFPFRESQNQTNPALLSVGKAPKVVSKYMPCVSVPPGVIISAVGWGVGAGSEQLTLCTASCFTASGSLLCLMATIRGCFLSLTRKFSLQSEEYRTWKALFSVS